MSDHDLTLLMTVIRFRTLEGFKNCSSVLSDVYEAGYFKDFMLVFNDDN